MRNKFAGLNSSAKRCSNLTMAEGQENVLAVQNILSWFRMFDFENNETFLSD